MGSPYYFVCRDEWLLDGEVDGHKAYYSFEPVFATWCFVDESSSAPHEFTDEINEFLFCMPADVTILPEKYEKIIGSRISWISKVLWNTLTDGMIDYILFELERKEASPYLDRDGLLRWLRAHVGREVILMDMRYATLYDRKFPDDPLRIGPTDKEKEF